MPAEVSRCLHHARVSSTHGVKGEAARISKLLWNYVHVPAREFTVVLPSDVSQVTPSRVCACNGLCPEPHRGTYNGVVTHGFKPYCVNRVQKYTFSSVEFNWHIGAKGSSCSSVCNAYAETCSPKGFLESATLFVDKFGDCDYYGAEMGIELPSVVSKQGKTICNVPVLNIPPHKDTRRLCSCFTASKSNVLYYL